MNYTVRDGIILKNICDVWLLIAVGEAAEHCLYVREINDSLAWYWQMITAGRTKDEIVSEALSIYDAPKEQICQDLEQLISNLVSMGYLIEQQNNPEMSAGSPE